MIIDHEFVSFQNQTVNNMVNDVTSTVDSWLSEFWVD